MRHPFTRHPVLTAALAIATIVLQAPDASAARSTKTTTTSGPAFLSFDSDRVSVQAGETALLSWAALNVTRCMASGAWSGRQKDSGSYRTEPLVATSTFTLTCLAASGNVEKAVVVEVASAPTTTTTTTATTTTGTTTEPTTTTGTTGSTTTTTSTTTSTVTPKLLLQVSTPTIKSGADVTLTWSGEAVSNCQASGAWTGSRAISGSEVRTQITASESYTLTCDSASGQVMAMTSVQVYTGGTQISWQPPDSNIDGSPLVGLAAYRIYVGTASQTYDLPIELTDVATTQYFVDLLPGEYYIAMTAVDLAGNESAYSNEVHKVIQ